MDANYSVKRNPLSGAALVNFKCPACAAAVKFDLDDAGTRQPCPACGVALAVPGTREKQSNEAAVKAKAEDQKRAKAERERAAKEIAEAEAARASMQEKVQSQQEAANKLEKSLGLKLRQTGRGLLTFGIALHLLVPLVLVLAGIVGEKPPSFQTAGFAIGFSWLLIFLGTVAFGFGLVSAEIHRWGSRIEQRLSAIEQAQQQDESQDRT